MKYIMKDGAFLNKETGATTPSLTGKLAGIRCITADSGAQSIQIDLAGTDEDGNSRTDTISVRRYGDASAKILRLLFAIADIIAGKELTFCLESRGEGEGALITLIADGEKIVPAGYIEPFAAEKKAMIDRMLYALRGILEYRLELVVFANKDGYLPKTEGRFDARAAAEYIRELRRSGRGDELLVKKTVFTDKKAADGYLKAMRDIAGFGRCTVLPEEGDAELLLEAFTEQLEFPETDEDGVEAEY